MSTNPYFDAFDGQRLATEYPLGDDFVRFATQTSADQLRELQQQRFGRCMKRAWQIPFYQRLWGDRGLEPGDIRGLQDIEKLPTFGKPELMASVERAPPLGDYHGRANGEPMIVHTTSGTTGRPQPLLFGPRGREIQNLLLGRAYTMQGLGAADTVHSVYGHGLINGGHYVRESVLHWTRALFLSAGTGVETRSIKQVELMRDFAATAVVGFADYIKKLAQVAVENGIEPGRDIPLRTISGHMGRESRQALSDSWGGAEVFDWYGVGDTGCIAAEGPDHDGLYVMEDAQFVEVLDPDQHSPVGPGERGNLVVTCLYKDDIYPVIRFDTKDVTAIRAGSSSLGFSLRRIEGFLGRSDNMIKLRGINIYPQALGPILEAEESVLGEFLCVAERDAQGRDELTVWVEIQAVSADDAALTARLGERLRGALGVQIQVQLALPGSLAARTGIETRQKPIRLIDNRSP